MADDVLVDNGDEADYTVSADDASGKYVQRVKLAYSADGSATHVPADADGLLVNLGANNDVTVSGVATEATLADVLTDTGAIATAVGGTLDVAGTVTANLAAGTNNIGDVDVTSIAAGTNTIGAVNIKPTTSGGLSIFRSIDLDETEEDVKTSAGQLFGWYLYNAHSAVLYVKLYNATAANVTVGTTTPVMTIPVPPSSGANVEFTNGIAFSTAICAACTTGVADNDTGAPAANVLIANFLYA